MENISNSSGYDSGALQDRASSPVNASRTCETIGTELTQADSRSVPLTGDLKRLRDRVGYDSPIGHRCSNIMELMDQCPRPPEEWIAYLMPDSLPAHYEATRQRIAYQAADLQRLLSQPH